jgi:hypothetical protein
LLPEKPMKKFFLLPLIIFGLTANATNYYISNTGNNSNTGTSSSPWLTLAYASNHAKTSGDIIHVASGTYKETARINLAVGVSIVGAGVTSIIQSTYSVAYGDANDAIIKLGSYGTPTTTPQSISYLKIDGRNWTSTNAISVVDRSNISISNCTIINFKIQGIHFGGGTAFSSNNAVYNCVINDCATRHGEGSATASIYLVGTTNLKIYNNTFSQTARVVGGNNGNIIGGIASYSYSNSGLKIYNNTFTKASNDSSGFNFNIELWNVSNECEIYGNTFNNGTVDVCGIQKGSGTYGLDVHDNNFLQPTNPTQQSWDNSSTGLNLEDANGGSLNGIGVIQYVHIYNNLFQFTGKGITIDATISDNDNQAKIDHIYVYNNVFDGIGWTNNPGGSIAFHMNGHNQSPIYYDYVELYNNTFVGNSRSAYGYRWSAGGTNATHIKIRNNIFQGLYDNPIDFSPITGSPTINILSVENNLFYNNGTNAAKYSGVTVTNKTEQNNLVGNPLFISSSDYHLQAGSPSINSGINVGLPYLGNAPDIGRYEYAAINSPPVANAGLDQTILLPTSVDTLKGSGSDSNGTISSYSWTKISGPSGGSITNATSAATTVTGLVQGIYQFELKVTDNNGATGRDTLQLTVNAAGNISPVANAGTNQTITLPTNTVSLSGSGTDADGTAVIFFWTKISGPAADTILNANSASTSLSGLVQGVYLFELKVTDNNGAIGRDTMQLTVNAAGNISPVANAGTNQTITLPTNTVSLSGSGTDADGTISSYNWTKSSGPSAGTITNSTSAATTVTGLVQGVYVFQLKVTDNNGATATSTMQVTVNAAAVINIAPVANAGSNKSITLPVNTASLAGSGTDADGTITNYLWTKIAGPSTFNIVNAASPVTDVSGLVQGVYQFELKVTDNNGAIGRDTMQLTVNAAGNISPVANAGTNQTITLPTNTVSLSGSGTDADGTISSYNWTKSSGPSAGTITNSTSAATTVTGLVQGVYVFQLKVTDNNGATATSTMQVTVNAAAVINIAPVANAGSNKSMTLPVNTASLAGSGTDADGTITNYLWTKISGPSTFNIVNAASPVTDVSGLVQGVYQFELKVTDNNGAIGRDTMQLTVNAAGNISPVANAGTNQTITLPTNTVSLSGSGTDADGTISSYNWTKSSGPSAGTITNSTSAATTVTGLVQGVYVFQLKVTDNNGATATSTMQVTVNAAAVINIAPVANAGSNKSITLPVNTASLAGSGTDADGTITNYLWTKIAGPSTFNIVNAASPVTDVSGLVQGVYQFELKVTDNNGAIGRDTMQLTVNAAGNISPVANAGTNQTITLPTNTVSLSGSGTDADGTISSYNWTKSSGPSAGTITNSTSAATTVTGLVQGVYVFQLKVTDNNGATATSTMQVTVNAAAVINIAPVANAGTDITVSSPVTSVNLNGSGTDADGTISGYQWRQISGPGGTVITSPSSALSAVNNLTGGTYEFELTVTDNNGAIGKDTMVVVVALSRLSAQLSNNLTVYPNPVIDILTVEISTIKSNSNMLLVISDFNGRTVYKEVISSSLNNVTKQINMSNYTQGAYTITLFFNGKDKQTVKIIKL